ncbi:C-C motif chemokine 2-like [Clupea harengus]|uniref:C-C motif chemokine 2-like n=1 Tax=Clupea harengus TaxID=7950 RepID=A0A6P8FQL4_CLUHA|nr:C-C motif chemokine 2-like [Clupea harengus]
MKTTCICLALGLTMTMVITSEAFIYGIETAPMGCCFNFLGTHINIPLSQIRSANRTNPKCPKPAIVATTVLDKDFCVKPTSKFGIRLVKRVIKA